MRVVLDANVLVSALISQGGPPREIVGAWIDERFELIASPALLEELHDVLARPRFRRWVSLDVAAEFIDGIAHDAVIVSDSPAQPGLTPDPDDDYLVALGVRCKRTTWCRATATCSTSKHPTRRCSRRARSSTCSAPDYAARGPWPTPPTAS